MIQRSHLDLSQIIHFMVLLQFRRRGSKDSRGQGAKGSRLCILRTLSSLSKRWNYFVFHWYFVKEIALSKCHFESFDMLRINSSRNLKHGIHQKYKISPSSRNDICTHFDFLRDHQVWPNQSVPCKGEGCLKRP